VINFNYITKIKIVTTDILPLLPIFFTKEISSGPFTTTFFFFFHQFQKYFYHILQLICLRAGGVVQVLLSGRLKTLSSNSIIGTKKKNPHLKFSSKD
jgi:hypothetical protein